MPRDLFDLTPDALPSISIEEGAVHPDGKSLAEEIIGSQEYRLSVKRRITEDTLPAAVELFYLHTLYGKPTEKRELTFPEGVPDLSGLTDEELAIRAERIAQRIRLAASVDAAETPKKSIM